MYQGKKVSVIIPTYNEEGSIAGVIDAFFATGLVDEVVAVDNNARGNTAQEIQKTKARHIRETENQGYGHAIMRGLREATGDLLIMVEADGTFEAKDIRKFLEYSDDFDVVFGTRTSRAAIWSGAFMPVSVRIGNWAVAKLLEVIHNGPSMTDVGCTYKLISRKAFDSIKDLFLRSPGDGTFSPELMLWLIRRKFKPIEIPVNFKARIGDSMYTGSVWKAARLGFRMAIRIIGYRFVKI
jgi:glycosyltransferase involved in cell wall biosynthesis